MRKKISKNSTWDQIIMQFKDKEDAYTAETKWIKGDPYLKDIPMTRRGTTIVFKTDSKYALGAADNIASEFRKYGSAVKLTYR